VCGPKTIVKVKGARSVTNVYILSLSVPLKKNNGSIKSQTENVILSVKNAADFASPHSECSTPKQSSEEYTKAKDRKILASYV